MAQARILVIDDDEAIRDAVAEDLKREDYSLIFAENGAEGILRLRENSPTVILLDLRMPVMDGFQFLDCINLQPHDPYSVVVLTGHGDADAIKACYESGVSTFIKKPFNLYEIRGVVKNSVAVKQLTNNLDELVKERTAELEQRMREVNALNQMFQEQLSQRMESDTSRDALIDGLEQLSQATDALLKIAKGMGVASLPGPAGESETSESATFSPN